MISKQHQFSLCVVSALLSVWMDVVCGMMSIQLIPQYPVIGGSVTMSVTGITGTIQNFIWYKGLLPDSDYQIFTYFPIDKNNPLIKGKLYHDRITPFSNGSALISNLNKGDEGNYIVRIQTDKPSDVFVNLTIYEIVGKPTITSSTSMPKENSPLNLTCSATNSERIVWSRVPPGATLYSDNRTLSFSTIKRLDAGDYSCEATNPVSQMTSDPITITVAYGPENIKVKVELQPNSLTLLKCSADSVPPPTYNWRLNGTDLNAPQSTYQVDQKKAENEGNYTCVASNSVMQLTVKDSVYVNATIDANVDGNGGKPTNMPLIIGIVIAVILLLVLSTASVFLFVIHKRRKRNLVEKSSTIKTNNSTRNGHTIPSATPAPEQSELQYADIVFSKNMPRKPQPPPDSIYANRTDIVRPQETLYSELRIN